MTAQAYALVEHEGRIFCSERNDGHWGCVKLQGTVGTTLSWVEALDELNNRICSERKLADIALCLMMEDQSPKTLAEISRKLEVLKANEVSLYPMRWMLESFANGDLSGLDMINQILLGQVSNPRAGLISSPLPISSERSNPAFEETELEAYCKQLQMELDEQKRQHGKLKKDNDKLQKDNANLMRRLMNNSKLLSDDVVNSYLASIFNNYWGNVSLDDHCVHAKQINKPQLSSPVHEPSDICIRQVVSEISRLSSDERLMLSEICQKLVLACSGLKVRHEFEFLLDDPQLRVTGDI